MKISQESILGLPSNYKTLLLLRINPSDYCAVIIPRERIRNSGIITGAEVAIGKDEEDLFFVPVETFFVYNDFYSSWILESDELIKLQGIQGEVYLKDKSNPLDIIFSAIY